MPVEYRIDTDRGVVHSRAWGDIGDGDFVGHQHALRDDPDFRPSLNQIFDMRGIESVERLTPAGIRSLAEGNPFGAGSRRLVLTASKVVFGLARMFQTMTDDRADLLRVIYDEAYLAEKWLVGETPEDGERQE